MLTAPSIEDRIRQYLLASFLAETPPGTFHNHDDLFELLDSLQILRLVSQLESWFSIKVDQQELSADNLSSVERAAAFVVRKLGQSRAGKQGGRVLPA